RGTGQELPHHGMKVANRSCEQQFRGAPLLFLGKQAHGKHRNHEKQHDAHGTEKTPGHDPGHVHRLRPWTELALHHRGLDYICENSVKEQSRQQEPERQHNVRNGRDKIRFHLTLPYRQYILHSASLEGCAKFPSQTSSFVTRLMKTSSRLMETPRNSRSPHPCVTTAFAMSRLRSVFSLHSTVKPAGCASLPASA